jgi:hypothetical protein
MRVTRVAVLLVAFACGGSTAGNDGGTDASTDVGATDGASTDVSDAASADVSDGAFVCSPELPDTYAPTWILPNAPTSACTATQIQTLYDDCLGPSSNGSLCNTFLAQSNNKTCEACLESPITASTYGATIEWHSGSSLDINVGGCIALIDGDLSATGCGAKYEAWLSCQIAACSYCPPGTYTSCATPAETTTCGAYQAAAKCANDPKYAACTSEPSFEAAFTTVGAMFCSAD